MSTEGELSLLSVCCDCGLGADMPATSPPATAPATSAAPIETHQRIAALPSFQGDRDMHDALRKAGTRVLLHIPVSRVGLAEFTGSAESLDERSGALKSSVFTTAFWLADVLEGQRAFAIMETNRD